MFYGNDLYDYGYSVWSIIPKLNFRTRKNVKKVSVFTKNFCQHRSVSYHRRPRCSDYQRTWRQLYWLPQIRINYRSNLYFYNGCLRYQPAKETAGATGTAEKMKFRDIFTVIKKNDQLRWAVLLNFIIQYWNSGYHGCCYILFQLCFAIMPECYLLS